MTEFKTKIYLNKLPEKKSLEPNLGIQCASHSYNLKYILHIVT